jgi:hypothetical protein
MLSFTAISTKRCAADCGCAERAWRVARKLADASPELAHWHHADAEVRHVRDGILLDGRQVLESQGIAEAAEACCRAVHAISPPDSRTFDRSW